MTAWEGLLGLCARARRVQLGEGAALACLREGTAKLVLLDESASDNARKRFRDACQYRGVPLRELPAGHLGRLCGRPGRMTAAVTDPGFSERILALLDTQNTPD